MSCATSIIDRYTDSFNSRISGREHPDILTKDIGGHFRKNEPYTSGYFHMVAGLPMKLFKDEKGAEEASIWLHSTCENFTPHSVTRGKADTPGLGGRGASFQTNTTITREFGLTFREYQNMPILNIIRRWSAFDPFTGVSPLGGNEFIPTNKKGWICILQTKPVRAQDAPLKEEDLEEVWAYGGVWPVGEPVDTAAASDIATNDQIQLSVQFSFDGAPLTGGEPGVAAAAVKLLNQYKFMCEQSTYGKWLNAMVRDMKPWGTHSDSTVDSTLYGR
jgi:hypothetical protein